jgi:hypothetical protein
MLAYGEGARQVNARHVGIAADDTAASLATASSRGWMARMFSLGRASSR